jgi:hypothetical protein
VRGERRSKANCPEDFVRVVTDVDGDDLFVWPIAEGKAMGTAREVDIVFLDKDQTIQAMTQPDAFKLARKSGVTMGRRKLSEVQRHVRRQLKTWLTRFLNGTIDEDQLRERSVRLMKNAWRDVFRAGVKAAGIKGLARGVPPELTQDDTRWLRSAMQHEMRFLNGMLRAVIDETYVMPLPRRVELYVRTLESFYDSARVIGLPATMLIHWSEPKDEKVCASCVYLYEQSPYTKATLPTTPRSGATLCVCLLDCRVRVLTRLGWRQVKDVSPGDLVWTHRRRWRRVVRSIENKSVAGHRYAVVVGNTGRLVGVTDDHRFMVDGLWQDAREIAKQRGRVDMGGVDSTWFAVGGSSYGPGTPRSRFLLSELLEQQAREWDSDPAVRLLRQEFLAGSLPPPYKVEIGEVILLAGVLDPGTPLFDLEVNEDSSFLVEGLVSHNSNCRDRLILRRALSEDVMRVTRESPSRDAHIRALRTIKRQGHL